MTATWAVVEPKMTLIVTDAPAVQKLGDAPTVERGAFSVKEVWAPGWSVKSSVSNTRGLPAVGVPAGPPIDQIAGPPDVMLQGAAQAGAVVLPVSVPAKSTWHPDGVQEIGLPPSFLIEIDTAVGEFPAVAPALAAAPTITMLVFEVALPIRL